VITQIPAADPSCALQSLAPASRSKLPCESICRLGAACKLSGEERGGSTAISSTGVEMKYTRGFRAKTYWP
jgi:hypothetical protein